MTEKITPHDIQHLATLSRIAVSDEEAAALADEFGDILGYVEQVKEVSADTASESVAGAHSNIMREDTETHEPGAYTNALLEAAPDRHGRYVQVKKILGNEPDNG